MSQEIGVGGAKLGLGGGKFEVVLPKAFGERVDVGVVSRGVGVEDDDVVEVGGDAFEVFDDLADDLDEPPGRRVATLRHDEPLEEAGGGAEGGEWYGDLVDVYLVERRYKVEQGNFASFCQGIKDLVDAGDGELPQEDDGMELFVVHRYLDVAFLLEDGDHGAGVRRGRVLNKACGQVLVEHSIDLLGEDMVDPVGVGEHGGAVRGNGNLERNK